jgi:excisionase family DNA binding protein
MDERRDVATVSEAAAALAVARQRVLRLIADGELRARRSGRQWLVNRIDLDRRAERAHPAGGRFSPLRAWGVLFLADGRDVPWLDRKSRWFLERQLAAHGLSGLRERLERRGRPHYLRAHPGDLGRLASELSVIATGASAARASDIIGSERLDAYVPEPRLSALGRRYHLEPSWNANVILRELPATVAPLLSTKEAPATAVAIDLLDDEDPRSQEAGRRLLSRFA